MTWSKWLKYLYANLFKSLICFTVRWIIEKVCSRENRQLCLLDLRTKSNMNGPNQQAAPIAKLILTKSAPFLRDNFHTKNHSQTFSLSQFQMKCMIHVFQTINSITILSTTVLRFQFPNQHIFFIRFWIQVT